MAVLPTQMMRRATPGKVLIVALCNVLAISLVFPVLPNLIGQLAGNREAQSYWYGAIATVYGATQFLSAALLGALSDRFGRRPVLLLAVSGLGLDMIFVASMHSLLFILIAQVFAGLTAANVAIESAYLADVTSLENRSKSFGALGAMYGLGFVLGAPFGALLSSRDLHYPFYAAAGVLAANLLFCLFALPESLGRERRSGLTRSKANPFSALAGLSKLRSVGFKIIAVYSLVMLAQFVVQSSWVLYTEYRYGWGSTEVAGSFFAAGTAAVIAQGWLMGVALRRLGDARTMLAGLAFASTAFLFYGLASAGWMIFVIMFMNLPGLVIPPALQGIASKAVDPSEQGVTLGALNAISSLTIVVAPAIATPLLANTSHLAAGDWRVGITFYLSAALETVALGLAWWHFRQRLPTNLSGDSQA